MALPSFDLLFDSVSPVERWTYVREHRDAFVGRVLIGVLSTGIYCLPSCKAREPKPENVRYFKTEAEARAAGLRPCRRCRPDDFYRAYDPDFEGLAALVNKIRRDSAAFPGLDSMAAASGIGVTKLHALFQQHYHTTPAAFLNRTRVARACDLLTDPHRQVIDVAYAAGYDSLSTFHDNFRRLAGLSPREYQRLGACFSIALPEGYVPWVTLKLLGRDPESCIERASGRRATKALQVGSEAILLHLEWEASRVNCRVESAHPLETAVMQQVHTAVVRMLGLSTNPIRFERSLRSDPGLLRLVDGRQGLRIPLFATVFEGITWAIVGQQVNLAFAYRLRQHLAQLCGQPAGDGLIAHPTPEAVARLDYTDLTERQFSRRKAEYLIDAARLIASGELVLDPLAAASQIEKRLSNVRGLGPWSVHYIMMRALGFADCVPLGDTGLSTALKRFRSLDHRPDSAEVDDLMKPFKPYRSLATYHLWLSLGDNPI